MPLAVRPAVDSQFLQLQAIFSVYLAVYLLMRDLPILKFANAVSLLLEFSTNTAIHLSRCISVQEAAKSLGLGLSVMKRVCRTLGLTRWPYTTRTSLRRVIERTELYLVSCKNCIALSQTEPPG